jgi:hypothetical protein
MKVCKVHVKKNNGLCVHFPHTNCKPSYLFRALKTYEGVCAKLMLKKTVVYVFIFT